MSPIVTALVWALVGATVSLALRQMTVRSCVKASLGAVPPALGILEGLTATLFAAFAYRHGMGFELLVFTALVTTCVPLAALDLVARKLPNVLVGATYLTVLPILGLDAILNGPYQFVRAAVCMAAALALHGVLYATGSLGGGDLKLVGILAAALGWVSWTAAWTGLVTSWVVASAVVLVGRAFRRETGQRSEVPLGLFLIAGTLATALALTVP
jgi:leader peptidase (prepilin peptidase) / N-methyltransferase